jgi:hypothetical protein
MSFLFGGGSQATASKQQNELAAAMTDVTKYGLSQAKSTIPKAMSALQLPLDFWTKILSGDRQSIMSTLTPEVSSVSEQYQAGRKAASEFSPRSGGRAAGLSESRFKEAGDIQNLISGMRTTSADEVTQLGQILGNLGLGELGASTSAAGTGGKIATARREQSMEQAAGFGEAAGSMASILLGLI